MKIQVESLTKDKLQSLGVPNWPIWTKEPSGFDWHYDEAESCYFLEGEVTVKTEHEIVNLKKGDFVTFPKGLDCVWEVKKAVRKHYRFGS